MKHYVRTQQYMDPRRRLLTKETNIIEWLKCDAL